MGRSSRCYGAPRVKRKFLVTRVVLMGGARAEEGAGVFPSHLRGGGDSSCSSKFHWLGVVWRCAGAFQAAHGCDEGRLGA